MLKSLPDVLRSFWSKPANDIPSPSEGRKRKRDDTEWEDDPDVQIVKVEKKRRIDSLWNILNLPSKMAEWMKLKPKPFSEQFSTRKTKTNNQKARDTKVNGDLKRIRQLNGNRHAESSVHRINARYGDQGLSRGLPNGEQSDSSHNTSRQSDKVSLSNTFSRPLKTSTSTLCIRLKEREEYERLLRMHSKLATPQSWNVQSLPEESDVLSISSCDSSNVSLLGTTQCLSHNKHASHDPVSIPHFKKTPKKVLSPKFSSDTRTYSARSKPTEMMRESLSSLVARQKKRQSLCQSQSENFQSGKESLIKFSCQDPQNIIISDDDICVIDDDEKEPMKTATKIPARDNHSASLKKELPTDTDKSKLKGLGFLDSVYTRDGYLQEMQKSRLMHSEQWKRQVEDEEMKAKAYEEKRKAQTKELERRLKHQMRIFEDEPEVSEEIFIEEEEEEEEEEETLPDLTDSMMAVIRAAMNPNPPGEVVSDAFSLKITRRDVSTLSGLNWLNDEIINFYMNMLIDRGKQEGMPDVYAFNTFFYPKIMSGGHAAVKRWTKKVDLFAMHYVLIPVHLGMHWCLCVANIKDEIITYYDSMGARNQDCLKAVLKYINDESVAKRQTPINQSEWTLETAVDNPQQMNGSDCGMFACKYAEYITRGKQISFSQSDMPYFRLRMAYEIVTKKLLQ